MAEFISVLQEIQHLPPEQHLFCPRANPDDADRYEDIQADGGAVQGQHDPERLARIEAAKARRQKFMTSLQLLAYDGQESEQYQRFIFETLDHTLGRCDICIREYYIAKLELAAALRLEYEEDDIKTFFDIINRRDIDRIIDGLKRARDTLTRTPEQKRGTSVLDPKHLHALFEALVCDTFLRREDLLVEFFDEPFKLVQTKKPLKMREILPGATHFLFSTNPFRLAWAISIWNRVARCPTDLEWDWAMKEYIQTRLQVAVEPADLSRLWSALKLILGKLDKRMITFRLFDLHPSICTTALNHLARRSRATPFIVQSMKLILEIAPDAFLQGMGSISSQTIVEQVFASPMYEKCLEDSAAESEPRPNDVLSWIPSFLTSLKPGNRPFAAQTLSRQLFQRVDNEALTLPARTACFDMGVNVLLMTVISFSGDEANRCTVERPVLLDTLTLVGDWLADILKPKVESSFNPLRKETKDQIVNIVKNALALECQCLKADFATLTSDKPLRHGPSYSPEIWHTVINNLDNHNPDLSSAALLGIMPLPGLEQFRLREGLPQAKDKKAYNAIFEQITAMVSKLLERIAEFDPRHLDHLFRAQNTSMSLIAMLFSPDSNAYQAAIEMVKNISGEPGRKEALAHLISSFLGVTVYGLCWAFRRISNYKTFASVPRMLKNGMEILDVLCNPTNGQLRRVHLSTRDAAAVQNYWGYQWIALQCIYHETERWSMELHDKAVMVEVCRDAMQYAEALFDQYDLFASALIHARPDKALDIPSTLLDSRDSSAGSPLHTLDAMSRWLRLRDEYLAETLVSLITKMLDRLHGHQVLVRESDGLNYVEDVAAKASIRTTLSASQRARLVQALEKYYDRPIERPAPKKQSKLNFKDWADASKSDASTPISIDPDDEFGDDGIDDEDLIELSKGMDLEKTAIRAKDPKETRDAKDASRIRSMLAQTRPVKARVSLKPSIDLAAKRAQEARAFIENRKREEAARKLRDKGAALKLRAKAGINEQTAGQGSGMTGIGVVGKDHSAGPSSLMVSSESESESDSDRELFGTVASAGATVRTQAGLLKPVGAGPVRKVKQVRSQKDVRARLAPDLSELHRTILGWDFFADTDLPPGSAKDDYTLVTDTFRTAQDYQKTFEPLLILEGWQSFRAAREEGNFKSFEVKVANSLIVDSFFEVNSQMSLADGKELGIGVSDVVLLSKSQAPEKHPDEAHCLARVKEIMRKKGEVQVVYRVKAAHNPLRPFLNDKSVVHGVQILSLTPLEREYGALMALQYYDLSEEIIRAKPSPILDYSDRDLQPIQKIYGVNVAQAKAVKSAFDNDAFTLIQGPPGSGKTKTICALVGAMLSGSINGTFKTAPVANAATGRSPRAKKKMLVCAPSNAAVDELVMRFKAGVTTLDGSHEKLSVVRLGRSDAINSNVKDVTLEELVNAKLSTAAPKDPKEDIHAVMMDHKAVSGELNSLRHQVDTQRGQGQPISSADEQLMDALKRKKNLLSTKIDDMRERQNTASRDMELSRKRIQQEILDSAHVLCATLSGSGHEIFQSLNVEFETVIIDEAAQSIELSALIPLKYGCSKCILVGDPKQLPPTVLSREAAKFQYEQSLFARMAQNHKNDVHLLDTQYRMHPEISLFPSKTFYESRLKDGPDMAKLRRRPWHHSDVLGPYRFFDVQGMSQAATKGHSLINMAELNVAMQLYDRLITDVSRYNFTGNIGIITPYKGQLKELKSRFKQRYGDSITSKIEFNTTDAFQGRESEIIIFSCVRASTKGIGFLNDIRRMNVGLTRAKCSLWVLGNSDALQQGEFWRALINDAKSRLLYTSGDIISLFRRPLLTPDMMKDDVEMLDADNVTAAIPRRPTPSGDLVTPDPKPLPQQVAVKASLRDVPSSTSSRQQTPNISRPSSAQSLASTSSSKKLDDKGRGTNSTGSRERSAAGLRSEQRAPMTHLRTGPGPVSTSAPRYVEDTSGLDGPSGGRSGLNDLANCAICGSHEHFTLNCDNEEAKASSIGNCRRCHLPGHTYTSCDAVRCITCGEVGHLSPQCRAPPHLRLNPAQQAEVRRQELRFGAARDKARERRTEKRLGEHGAKIPIVKASTPTSATLNGQAKRKRDEGQEPDRRNFANPNPGRDSSHTNVARHSPPSAPRALGPPGRPTMANNGQPIIRKKKKADADAMFMKKR